jgi:type VI secretion system protein ImpK
MNSNSTQHPPVGGGRSYLPEHQGRLSLGFQEPLTVAARVRRGQFHAPDSREFRSHIRHLLAQADGATRESGYPPEFAKLATYAVVALLDESILTSPGPLRGDWVGFPLQQELFGENVAGENFYLQLRDLLGRPDSRDLADILELFLLCLLLGFKGRYAASDGAEIQGLITATTQKVNRIRGGAGAVTPQAGLPAGEAPPERKDPWVPRLIRATFVALGVALVLFVGFRLLLASGNSGVRELVETMIR